MRILLAFLVCLAVCHAHAKGPYEHEAWTASGKVVRVYDGDTIDLQTRDRGVIRIRFAGIDAPERGQAFARKAAEHLQLLLEGKATEARCFKTDDFGREVCNVFVADNDIGLEMLRAGLAWHFKRFQDEQEPADRDRYARAEEEARAAGRGLWAGQVPMAPWECRRAKREGGACR